MTPFWATFWKTWLLFFNIWSHGLRPTSICRSVPFGFCSRLYIDGSRSAADCLAISCQPTRPTKLAKLVHNNYPKQNSRKHRPSQLDIPFYQPLYGHKVKYYQRGWRHSSVESSAPTILLPWVRVPSTF